MLPGAHVHIAGLVKRGVKVSMRNMSRSFSYVSALNWPLPGFRYSLSVFFGIDELRRGIDGSGFALNF